GSPPAGERAAASTRPDTAGLATLPMPEGPAAGALDCSSSRRISNHVGPLAPAAAWIRSASPDVRARARHAKRRSPYGGEGPLGASGVSDVGSIPAKRRKGLQSIAPSGPGAPASGTARDDP